MKTDVMCRLVAQELGYGEALDELFTGTPSLMVVKMLLHDMTMHGDRLGIMVLARSAPSCTPI